MSFCRVASSFLSLAFVSVGFLSVGCTHTVNIRSEPAGAEIFVDGVSKGKSPVTFEETSSGGGEVEIMARLNGQETREKIKKDQINWSAVGGAGGGGGGAACLALNAAGCHGWFIVGPFAVPLNCLGWAVGVGVPIGVYFAAGQQMKDDIVVRMPSTAGAAAAPTAAEALLPPTTLASGQTY